MRRKFQNSQLPTTKKHFRSPYTPELPPLNYSHKSGDLTGVISSGKISYKMENNNTLENTIPNHNPRETDEDITKSASILGKNSLI